MAFHDLEVNSIQGEKVSLGTYKGKRCLVVNVASECGLTKQYKGLEQLHRDLSDEDFVVLGFPCNQFGKQEPGTNEEICKFAQDRFEVTFPMFEKIEVNGSGASELYQFLTEAKRNPEGSPDITWNFTKFLVDAEGNVVERFEPGVTPEQIKEALST